MSKVLYIEVSPRGKRSYSTAVAEAFIDAYKKTNPADEVISINLFNKDLPIFDGLALQAKSLLSHKFTRNIK